MSLGSDDGDDDNGDGVQKSEGAGTRGDGGRDSVVSKNAKGAGKRWSLDKFNAAAALPVRASLSRSFLQPSSKAAAGGVYGLRPNRTPAT